ncbi:MAG: hypothetical protein KGN34_01330 [Sphingomonadales bacterium]|nr:hypothetical protein [Sphingomonadales bacterium]
MPFAALPATSVLNTRPLIGWQTLLADLSLILFMVTAAAIDTTPDPSKPATLRPTPAAATAARPAAPAEDPRTEPIAVWRAAGDAPALRQWLRDQAPDTRQQLTIAIHYAGGAAALPDALARAARLGAEARAATVPARVLVEPGPSDTVAVLAYDRRAGAHATGTPIASKAP